MRAEVDTYLARLAEELDEHGHRLVVRNGYHQSREVAMAFKLIESAQIRWRAVNAPHLVTLVRTDAAFVNGMLIERPEEDAATPPVETAA